MAEQNTNVSFVKKYFVVRFKYKYVYIHIFIFLKRIYNINLISGYKLSYKIYITTSLVIN